MIEPIAYLKEWTSAQPPRERRRVGSFTHG